MNTYGLVRLTKDVELTYTSNNTALAKFGIAYNVWDGQENVAHFFNCVAFGKTAESLSNCKKGHRINITQAQVLNNNYEKDGVMRYGTQIKVHKFDFIEAKADTYQDVARNEGEHARRNSPSIEVTPDMLPF